MPARRTVVREQRPRPGYGVNWSNNPWRCVLTAPGMSTGQVGDYMAAATDNCDNFNSNSCQTFDCNVDGNYDGKTGSTTSWISSGGTRSIRA